MPPRPSAAEVALLRDVLHPVPALPALPDGTATVLEVSCGSGRTLATLSDRYAVQGSEPDPASRALARERLGPGAVLHEADLAALVLPEPVDVVLCLGGALCLAPTEEALAARCRALAAAVRPGGTVLIEPGPLSVFQGQAVMQTHDGDGVKIVRSAVSRVRGSRCQRDWFWLIARDGAAVQTFEERETRQVPGPDALARMLAAAGLSGDAEGALWRVRRAGVV